MQALLGFSCLMLFAWLTSTDRRAFPVKIVLSGLVAQFALALLLLKVPLLQKGLNLMNRAVVVLEGATSQGTAVVFGYLGGGDAPFTVTGPEHSFILAFRALPIVVVFAALSALLWHWRVIPKIINALANLLAKSMGLSGSVSVGAAASIFLGMVESPLLIKPQLKRLSDSELFMLMTCGMATVAGTVLGLYASILSASVPAALSHILVASLISAPAALLLAAIMVPPTELVSTVPVDTQSPYKTSMEALVSGTGEGLRLLANIIGMLIVFIALVSLVDAGLSLLPVKGEPVTLTALLGKLFAPLAWLSGIPWSEAHIAGELLATKVVVNELVAYLNMAALGPEALGEHSRLILTYALCGFANIGSLGIMIGGLTAMCPERSSDFLRLAPRSLWSGLLATCMTGCVISLLH